jgi:heme exporter protein A
MTLQARDICQTRGDRTLFTGLGFTLHAREALWVQGANGSGKTSLLRVLCGLSTPASGEVLWNGQPILRHREAFFRDVAYFGHASGVKDELSAWENLVFGATLAGRACTRSQALDVLAQLGLSAATARLPARALSQGQRRRAALARLLLAPVPRLLVLDEPFTALDAAGIDVLRERLEQHLAREGRVVYTTHQPLALQAARLQTLELNDATVPCVAR